MATNYREGMEGPGRRAELLGEYIVHNDVGFVALQKIPVLSAQRLHADLGDAYAIHLAPYNGNQVRRKLSREPDAVGILVKKELADKEGYLPTEKHGHLTPYILMKNGLLVASIQANEELPNEAQRLSFARGINRHFRANHYSCSIIVGGSFGTTPEALSYLHWRQEGWTSAYEAVKGGNPYNTFQTTRGIEQADEVSILTTKLDAPTTTAISYTKRRDCDGFAADHLLYHGGIQPFDAFLVGADLRNGPVSDHYGVAAKFLLDHEAVSRRLNI